MLSDIYQNNTFEVIFIILTFVIFNLVIFLSFLKFGKYFPITDKPDNVRKIHSENVKIFGGTILILNLILLLIFSLTPFSEILFDVRFFNDFRAFISFFTLTFVLFVIGIYDDIHGLNPYRKLFYCSLVFALAYVLNNDLVIVSFYSSTIDFQFELESFSYVFTIICFLLILNALNMFDGINLQVGKLTLLFFIIIFLYGNFQLFSLILIICILNILILNSSNKLFLGDSGVFVIAAIISFILIEQNSYNQDVFKPELIFIIFIIPGIDMIRLFIIRLIRNQNPFLPDREHLHHLLLRYHSFLATTLIIQSLIVVPILIEIIFGNFILSILTSLIAYIFLIVSLNLKIKIKK